MKVEILKPLDAVPAIGEPGDVIELSDRLTEAQARVLASLGRVRLIEDEPPEKRRRYQRRDLVADSA